MPEQPLTNVIEFDPEDEYRPEPEPEPAPPNWMDGSLRIGIHTSIAGGHLNALESAHSSAATPCKFLGQPTHVGGRPGAHHRSRRRSLSRAPRALGLGPLVITQIIDQSGAQQPMLRTRSIQAFHDELVRGIALGADFVVLHPGACGDCRPDQAARLAVESIKQAAKIFRPPHCAFCWKTRPAWAPR